TVASATGIVNLTRRYAEEYAGDAKLKQMIDDGQEVTAKDVFDLAKEKDGLALIVYRHFSEYLGVACANIAAVLNPAYIVLGGGVSAAGDFLLDGVRRVFAENSFPQIKESTQIVLATRGNDAGVLGAASLVLK
ncbi:ROK family protein, partial [Streptococcus ruminantium]